MARNTSITLGDHFDGFVKAQIESGRYGNVSEVMRAGLRLLEEHEHKIAALRQALVDGEESGIAGPMDMNKIKQTARVKAGPNREAHSCCDQASGD